MQIKQRNNLHRRTIARRIETSLRNEHIFAERSSNFEWLSMTKFCHFENGKLGNRRSLANRIVKSECMQWIQYVHVSPYKWWKYYIVDTEKLFSHWNIFGVRDITFSDSMFPKRMLDTDNKTTNESLKCVFFLFFYYYFLWFIACRHINPSADSCLLIQ